MAVSRKRWALILAALAACVGEPRAGRADELKAKLSKKLEEVRLKDLIQDRGEVVAVGDFTISARLNASGGLAVGNALIDVLQGMGVRVDARARVEVSGKITRSEVRGLNALKVRGVVEDTKDERVLLEFDVDVVDAATIMRVVGGTGDISGETRREQSDKLGRNLDSPSVAVAGTRIASSPGSPFAIEVAVKAAGGRYAARAATVVDGQAFVPLRRGDVYAVRLINDSDRDAAVLLAIDGLSMFTFSDTAADRGSRLIVPARGRSVITGWFRNNGPDGSNEFLVAPQAEAAVARQLPPSPAHVGMITAEFSVAWPKGTPPPPGESEDLTHGDDLATAIGKPIDQPFQKVEYLFGKPKTVVAVRYNKSRAPADRPR